MRPHEREALLARIDREGATVGTRIPERAEVAGEEIALRRRVLRLQNADPLTGADRDERDRLVRALRQNRRDLVERLEEAPIDRPTGERLVDRIVGIDRAMGALRAAGEDDDIEEAIRQQRVADVERWRSFVKRTRQGLDRSFDR